MKYQNRAMKLKYRDIARVAFANIYNLWEIKFLKENNPFIKKYNMYNVSERARRVVTICHPRYSIDPNFTNRVDDLTISGQYVLIYGSYEDPRKDPRVGRSYGQNGDYWPLDRYPIELWKLNLSQSVRIPLPDHKLHLTEDEKQKFLYHGEYYNVADTRCKWLLDPSSTPNYLVGIVDMGVEDLSTASICAGSGDPFALSGIVLVFDQLNDPQFLRRLVLPFEGGEIKSSRLLVAKGVEQTALVIGIEMDVPPYYRYYISDLANDFQEITPLNRIYTTW